MLRKIADILKVSVDALLGREVHVSTPQTAPLPDAPSAQPTPPAQRPRTRKAASVD